MSHQKDKTNFDTNFPGQTSGYAQDNGVITCEFEMSTVIKLDKEGPPVNILESTQFLFLAMGRHSEVTNDTSPKFGKTFTITITIVFKCRLRFTISDLFLYRPTTIPSYGCSN